jgi:uncharacterized protein (TIGR02145 family)
MSRFTKLAVAATMTIGVMGMAQAAFAQGADTAYLPFIVNVDATVKAERQGAESVSINVSADTEDTLKIPLGGTSNVRHRPQNAPDNAPIITYNQRGMVSVNLPAQTYQNAEVSLYSVNGRRILRTNADANVSQTAKSISRPNLVAGVYLLSVKSANGQTVSNRLTHRGGNLNISVAFRGNDYSPAVLPTTTTLSRQAAANAFEDWTITVSADGYADSVYTMNLSAGMNDLQNITLNVEPTPKRFTLTVNQMVLDPHFTHSDSVFVPGDGSTVLVNNVLYTGPMTIDSGTVVTVQVEDKPTYKFTFFIDWFWYTNFPISVNGNLVSTTFTLNTDLTMNAEFYPLIEPGTQFNPNITYNSFTDERNDRIYRYVKIGTQTWMAENLNWAGVNGNIGACYADDPDYCAVYGRHYNWAEAMNLPASCNTNICASQIQTPHHQGICPAGWHIPSTEEWEVLWSVVGTQSAGAARARSARGWFLEPHALRGTDVYGFSALPGGYKIVSDTENLWINGNSWSYWWRTTEVDANNVETWGIQMFGWHGMARRKSMLVSLRCLRYDD